MQPARQVGAARWDGLRGARQVAPVRAERGGREPLVAAERLGELGRLAVPDAARDLADGEAAAGEELRGALHPHAREVLAEGRVADLGVGALELAARRG